MITGHTPSEDGAQQAESGAPTLGRQFIADHRDLGESNVLHQRKIHDVLWPDETLTDAAWIDRYAAVSVCHEIRLKKGQKQA
jgi:hypothetical protein